jgi:maltose-binding protein MalE
LHRRKFTSAFAIAALALLTACLGRQPEPVIRLTWWVTYAEDSDEYGVFQAIADAYSTQAGAVVELAPVPWDHIAPRGGAAPRLAYALEAGEGPDVWGPVPHSWLEPYVARDQVLALEPAEIRDLGQYDDLALRAGSRQGEQYALPVLMDAVALIYNREMVPEPPTTWDELLEIAASWSERDSESLPMVLPLTSPTHVYPFMDGYGGYAIGCQVSDTNDNQCDPTDIGLNNEGSIEGIQLLSDLYTKEGFLSAALTDRAQMHKYALDRFVEGKAGMLIDGPWVLSEVRASEIDYSVAPLPALPGTTHPPRPLTVVYGFSASASTPYAEQAVGLLNHLASPESVVAMHQVLHRAPVRRDVMRLPAVRDRQENVRWRDQAADGVLLPSVPEMDAIWAPWTRALDEAIPGLRPVQDALDDAVDKIHSQLGNQAATDSDKE